MGIRPFCSLLLTIGSSGEKQVSHIEKLLVLYQKIFMKGLDLAEPQKAVTVTSIALQGRKVDMNNVPAVALPKREEVAQKYQLNVDLLAYEGGSVDYHDLLNIMSAQNRILNSLHQLRKEYDRAVFVVASLKTTFDQKKNRLFLQMTGGSDKTREALAELMCQKELNDYIVSKAIADELNRLRSALAEEAKQLENIGNNVRSQMKLL